MRRENLPALTGIRAAAAFWVLAMHYSDFLFSLFAPARALWPVIRGGYLGVDLFFVLSGFILAHNYLDRFRDFRTLDWLSFMKLRFARIYPVHFFTLHIAAAMAVFSRHTGIPLVAGSLSQYGFSAWLRNILLVNGWGANWHTCNSFSWTISVEWAMYLVFPLVAFLVVRLRSAEWSLIGAVGILAAFLYGTIFLTAREILDTGGGWLALGLFRGLAGTLTGILLQSARRLLRPSRAWGWISTVSALGIVAIPQFLDVSEFTNGMLLVPLLAVLVLSLSFGLGPVARLLSSRPALWWGGASYSLYMTSGLTHMALAVILPWGWISCYGFPARIAGLIFIGLAVAGITVATYRWIDLPWRRRLRNLPFLVLSEAPTGPSRSPLGRIVHEKRSGS